MSWDARYTPPDRQLWHRDNYLPPGACFSQIIAPINLLKEAPTFTAPITFGLVGFQCDEGVKRSGGRTGAAQGPSAIRQSLSRLPAQKPPIHCYDVGDIFCQDENLEDSQIALAEVIKILLAKNICPIVLGGGHELAWGHFQGIVQIHPEKQLGIINFDAHLDMDALREKKGNNTTAFLQIAQAQHAGHRRFDYNCVGIQHTANIHSLFETAKAKHAHIILADELHEGHQQKCVDFIDRVIDQNEIVYLTMALDVFAAPFAPGVSSTQPVGLTPWDVIPLLRQIAASGKVIGYDIAELCPQYDMDHRTAKLAADLVYEIIHHHGSEPRLW